MPSRFTYEAFAADGSVRKGAITSTGIPQVEEFLAEQGLMPIAIIPARTRQFNVGMGFMSASEYEQLIMFTNSLATMQRAGVPLLRALAIIRVGKAASPFNRVIEQLRTDIQTGKQLSEAMEHHPRVFSRVYVASVAAGEESGNIEQTLDELSAMLETELELNRQIKQATRYPMIVVSVIALAFLVMMTYVVPKFVDFYSAFDAELPLPTRMLIFSSNLITRYWLIALALAAAAVFGFRHLLSTDGGRLWFDRRMLKLPIIGNVVLKGNIARFALMFRILFRAGIPLIKTLDVLSATIKNTQIGAEIRRLEELFRKGREIQSIRGHFEFFPDMMLHMMAIGMESGSLDQMMTQLGAHFSKETMYRSRQLTAVLEPVLTLILGVFILILALAIFLPMWNLIKVFQN